MARSKRPEVWSVVIIHVKSAFPCGLRTDSSPGPATLGHYSLRATDMACVSLSFPRTVGKVKWLTGHANT